MSRRVWKYLLDAESELRMPVGAEILCVRTQAGHPAMWALVDSNAPLETRSFSIVGTGHIVEDGLVYVGTFHVHPDTLSGHPVGDELVGHVFERVAP